MPASPPTTRRPTWSVSPPGCPRGQPGRAAPVVRVESEIASGMNGARSKARRLLADPRVTAVVVEHKDRLGRMNVELVEAALSASGRRLVVLDDGEVEDDLVRDMVEVLTSFCARLYGRRSAKNRVRKALGGCRAWLTATASDRGAVRCPGPVRGGGT